MLPEMPDPKPTVHENGLVMRLLHDFERFSNGALLMKIADTHANVIDGEGNPVGSIGMSIGGGLYVELGGRLWSINIQLIFSIARRLDEKWCEENPIPIEDAEDGS